MHEVLSKIPGHCSEESESTGETCYEGQRCRLVGFEVNDPPSNLGDDLVGYLRCSRTGSSSRLRLGVSNSFPAELRDEELLPVYANTLDASNDVQKLAAILNGFCLISSWKGARFARFDRC